MSEVRVALGTADRGIALPRARAREDAPQRTRSAQPFRVAGYGRVDTAAPLSFTFDGKPVRAFAGDTVASALLAEGTHLVGRSFKYHRPRGIVSAGSEEPNALIGVIRGPGREEPNTRATLQEVFDGLATVSQNCWPSLGLDLGVVNDALSPILTAGFYYKTFLWPRGFWTKVYEPLIRSAAGLGRAPRDADPDRYASRYAHCDVLVVGAGAAGLSAALAAGRSGARVILADEQAEMGGSLLAETSALIDGAPAWDFLAATLAELSSMDNVRLLPRTTAIAYQHDNMVALAQRLTDHLGEPPAGAPRERLWRVRAREVVLAQGAVERPLVFDGNDRPGVMLASAGRAYLNRYGAAVGRRVVVATAHDSAWGCRLRRRRCGHRGRRHRRRARDGLRSAGGEGAPRRDRAAGRSRSHRNGGAAKGAIGAPDAAAGRREPNGRVRRAPRQRRLDALGPPLQPHQGAARLGGRGGHVPAGQADRGLPGRRCRPRRVGARHRARRRRARRR